MNKELVLITGANGEIGHGLICYLATQNCAIVALDLKPLDAFLQALVEASYVCDILDQFQIGQLTARYQFNTIYHLASILSTSAERNPELAHRINVDGTLNLLHMAREQATRASQSIKFIYPSSIAAYGLPDLATKNSAGKINEDQYTLPITMYGCNKLYCENLGRYCSRHYRQADPAGLAQSGIDFRCVRFPGLISAETIPTGGTSDYGPEMLHAAARGEAYACFVRESATLPFMIMPDAIKSLILLKQAERAQLSRTVYNVTSFSPTAREFYEATLKAFPEAKISFQPDCARQGIVDSWPADIDDSAARNDWGWKPDYNFERAFGEYLIPSIRQRYAGSER